jgi:hypothetical protein
MPAGRPTLYSEDMLAKAREYLEGGYLNNGKVIPSKIGLSRYLGVTRQTIDLWVENQDCPEFIAILDAIQADQHELLINSGLTGEFNSAIAKLALGKHGYSDKTVLEGGENPLQIITPWQVTGVKGG